MATKAAMRLALETLTHGGYRCPEITDGMVETWGKQIGGFDLATIEQVALDWAAQEVTFPALHQFIQRCQIHARKRRAIQAGMENAGARESVCPECKDEDMVLVEDGKVRPCSICNAQSYEKWRFGWYRATTGFAKPEYVAGTRRPKTPSERRLEFTQFEKAGDF